MATKRHDVNPRATSTVHVQSFVLRATHDEACGAWRYVVKSVDDALPYLFDDLQAAFRHIEMQLTDRDHE